MMNKEKDLLDYLKNCGKAKTLNIKIQEIREDIVDTEFALSRVEGIKSVEEAVLRELHNLRIKKLGLELDLNTVDREIIKFELAQELAD